MCMYVFGGGSGDVTGGKQHAPAALHGDPICHCVLGIPRSRPPTYLQDLVDCHTPAALGRVSAQGLLQSPWLREGGGR
jgi:hypothetical protein